MRTEAVYETLYYASLAVWAAVTIVCFAFYLREWHKTTTVLGVMRSELKPDETPGVKLYDAYASRQVCVTAMSVLLCQGGLIVIALVIVPPHTGDLTLRALLARALSIAAAWFLFRGYLQWRNFRDDEKRQSAYKKRMDEVKRSFGV